MGGEMGVPLTSICHGAKTKDLRAADQRVKDRREALDLVTVARVVRR